MSGIAIAGPTMPGRWATKRSEEHTSELQSQSNLVCRLLLEKKTPCADDIQKGRSQNPQSAIRNPQSEQSAIRNPQSAVLRMSLVGANERAAVAGLDEHAGKSNYIIGDDPSKWHKNVANFSRVHYTEIYPGVDLEYYGSRKQLEYDFRLAPGANADRVRLAFKGADSVRVDEASGDLLIETAGGELRQRRPVVYQETTEGRREIEGRYRLLEETKSERAAHHASLFTHHSSRIAHHSSRIAPHSSPVTHHSSLIAHHSQLVGFELGDYDRSLPLVFFFFISSAPSLVCTLPHHGLVPA